MTRAGRGQAPGHTTGDTAPHLGACGQATAEGLTKGVMQSHDHDLGWSWSCIIHITKAAH